MERSNLNKDERVDKKQEEIPFSCNNIWDDLVDWARKIRALGLIVGALSFYEKESADETLTQEGEILGGIIADYARAIELTVSDKCSVLNHLDEIVIFPMVEHQKVYDYFKSRQIHRGDLSAINYRIKELGSFIDEIAVPAIKLKASFEDLKNNISEIEASAQ